MVQVFLIKYAEIAIKGKNRYLFEDALVRQMRRALYKIDGQFKVFKESGRVYVKAEAHFDYDEVVDCLKKIFRRNLRNTDSFVCIICSFDIFIRTD